MRILLGRCNYRHVLLALATVVICSTYVFISSVIRVCPLRRPEGPRSHHLRHLDQYNQIRPIASNEDNTTKSLLTLFTTFRSSASKLIIHRNTIKNWGLLRPYVQPVLISTGKTALDKFAVINGWKIMEASMVNENGLPIIKGMFRDVEKKFDSVFYGFSNADILYDQTLLGTLNGIKKYVPHLGQLLIIGRRTNYKMKEEKITSLKQITLLGRKGRLFMPDAEDFFITVRNGYPWSKIKNVVIGRPGYDNYLVSMGIKNNATVIDISNTTLALHQTGSDGNFAGMQRKDEHVNKILIGPFDYYSGLTSCAQAETTYDYFGYVYLTEKRYRCTYHQIET